MKLILLAAAAMIATPALAQTSGSTGTSSPTSNGGEGTAATPADQNNTQGTMSTDPAVQTPAPGGTDAMSSGSMPSGSMSSDSTSSGSMSTAPAPMAAPMASGGSPAGGYQPSQPALSGGTPQPGGPVTFQAAPSPDQAYPAPAPLASYPVCKKGQYDQCMQASDARGSRARSRRRR